jgi:hypothetical protein
LSDSFTALIEIVRDTFTGKTASGNNTTFFRGNTGKVRISFSLVTDFFIYLSLVLKPNTSIPFYEKREESATEISQAKDKENKFKIL